VDVTAPGAGSDQKPAAPEAQTSPDNPAPDTAAPEPRVFTPVSDIIDQADAAQLDWLGHVSAGRRVRLKRLGYDVPEKLANLRRSEIRRLSRELSVTEEVIRNEWVPAAEAFLRDRQS
jgi:predicted flap endonuclease-1-like 5' DNA nuclease